VHNVVCIKWGIKYPARYVNRLFHGVSERLNAHFSFYCMTDDPTGIHHGVKILPLPEESFSSIIREELSTSRRKGAFGKISLFKPGLLPPGPVLGFDLDVVITGPLDDLLDYAPGKVCMRHDWLAARIGRPDGHGSVFRFDPDRHSFLYDDFAKDPANLMRKAKYAEQKYTSMQAQKYNEFAYFPNDWIASYKRDAMRPFPLNHFQEPRLPHNARVVCFHGRPKMEEAVAGYSHGIFKAAKPCRWLEERWAQSDLSTETHAV
jgi:hypothetical protein